jgi:peptidylprolyl isomerase
VLVSACALCFPHAVLAQQPAAASQSPAVTAADVVTPPADAQKTASGLAFKVVTPGSGSVKPTDTDLVKVAFNGWTKDGKSFSGPPPVRPMQMSQIILPGLSEGLKLMTTGQKTKLWLPEKLAFGGAAGKPAGPILLEVVLLDIVAAPATPADVATPPADAQKTKSGLTYKTLKAGNGNDHPAKSSTVTVHYSGWTTDGKMFDSSVVKGAPSKFPLDKVIAGWTEGVQLMVPGQACRFWVPEKLAYQGQEGRPKGMLVFDVELISIDAK